MNARPNTSPHLTTLHHTNRKKTVQYECDGSVSDEAPEYYQKLLDFIEEMLGLATELVPDRVSGRGVMAWRDGVAWRGVA
jgi:hypothetical protein